MHILPPSSIKLLIQANNWSGVRSKNEGRASEIITLKREINVNILNIS